jgi:C1A family cysteine protease
MLYTQKILKNRHILSHFLKNYNMKSVIKQSNFYKLLLLVATFCATTLSLSAQNDPLATALGEVHNPSVQGARMSARQAQVATKPAVKAKLDGMNQNISSKKLSFQVAYTPAMDRTKKQLVGTKRPATANAAAVKSQDDMNEKIIVKAQAELQQEKVAIPDVSVSHKMSVNKDKSRSLPASYFAGLKLLPEIKDQGTCGSCWAFAACAVYETAFRKFYGTSRTVNMSEQDMVDCGKTADGDDAGSCDGGYSDRAFDYIRSFGATTESQKPYLGADGTCTATKKNFKAYTWGQVYPDRFPTVDEVKKYVFTYGSVVTYMKAGIESFYAYKSGVYNDYASEDPYDVDHAVVIVGWDELQKAWIVRNSWGKDWGYSGYSYVSYTSCNIGQWVYWIYPKFTKMQVAAGPGGQQQAAALPVDNTPVEASPILKASRQ